MRRRGRSSWSPLVLTLVGCACTWDFFGDDRGCSGEGDPCRAIDDCVEGFICVPFEPPGEDAASFCEPPCRLGVGDPTCPGDRTCCGPRGARFCGDELACAGMLVCEEGADGLECPVHDWPCLTQGTPPVCGPASWAEPSTATCGGHSECASSLAYCTGYTGCRSAYAQPGSWCPLAARTLVRHEDGPLLFAGERLAECPGDACEPCGDGKVRVAAQLHQWDPQGDFRGAMSVVEPDGSQLELARTRVTYSDDVVVVRLCVLDDGTQDAVLVAHDAAGHRSNPLCIPR